jgi:hypothetical protein
MGAVLHVSLPTARPHDLGDICRYLVTIPALLDPKAAAILDH